MSQFGDKAFQPARAEMLVLALAAAIRIARYYGPENAVMQQAVEAVSLALQDLFNNNQSDENKVTVSVVSQCVFVGKRRVKAKSSAYGRFAHLIAVFQDWGIRSLVFLPGVSCDEISKLALIMGRENPALTRLPNGADKTEDEGSAYLQAQLEAAEVKRVLVDAAGENGSGQAMVPAEAFAAAMAVGEEMRNAGPEEKANIRRLRHVTQAVVDQVLKDSRTMAALTTIKEFDRYLISHATNVAVLSVMIGQRLGLSKAELGELCLAAFLHDAGKLEVDANVLNKPGTLSDREWEEVRRHPALAAKFFLDSPRLTDAAMRAVVVAFEHHMRYDLSGYPRTSFKDKVTIFGNIVAIADVYDALTTARAYRSYNFTPFEAMGYILERAGTQFDPLLVRTFVEIMGVFPVGTVVRLSNGEIGVVCSAPPVGTPLDRPCVRILVGSGVGQVVDLQEQRGDGYCLSIEEVINPGNKGQLPALDPALLEI